MANIRISQILMKRGNTAAAGNYIGPLGELLVDTGLQTVRVQDGVTPGGMAVLATLTGFNQLSGNIANLQTTTANLSANLSAFRTYANATFGTSNFGNANVAAYLTTNPQGGQYSNANVASYLTTSNIITGIDANVTAANLQITNLWSNAGVQSANIATLTANAGVQADAIAGANAAIITANTALKGYVDTQLSTLTNGASTALDTLLEIGTALGNNANFSATMVTWLGNVTANTTAANTTIDTLRANLGGYYTWANANVAGLYSSITAANTAWQANAGTQQGTLNAVQANIGSFYTYANLNYGTSSYANANVAAYLVANPQSGTYSNTNTSAYLASQNITSANIGGGQTYANTQLNAISANIGSFYTYANLHFADSSYGNSNVASYLPTYSGNVAADYVRIASGLIATGASPAPYISGFSSISTTGSAVNEGNITASGNLVASRGAYITGNIQASSLLISTSIIATGASPAPIISGFGSISTTGSAVNEGNITASGNLVASRGAYITGNITTMANVIAPNYLFPNGVNILSTVTSGSGTYSNANIVANLQNYVTNISSTANIATTANMIAPNYLFANGVNILSTITPSSSYSNTNVAAYLTTQTFYSNSNVAAYLVANPQGSTYSNANVVANLANFVTNIVSTANITAGNVIATQYGNSVGTTATYSGNVTAAYFVGNGSALTGVTYNNAGNIIGTSSNVTLQAGSYAWTFDTTGNLVIPTTGNITWANGTVFSSGTGSGGTIYSNANVVANLQNYVTSISTTANITTSANMIAPNYLFANGVNILSTVSGGSGTYSNANVVSMLAANTAVFVGNVGNVATVSPIQSNITQLFIGGNTTLTSGNAATPNSTFLMYNAYFAANGAIMTRNTTTGMGYIEIAASGIAFNGYTGATTANTVQAVNQFLRMNGSIGAQFSGAITTPGSVTAAGFSLSSGSFVTSVASLNLFQSTATTINLGGAATAINMGASSGSVVVAGNVFVGNAVGSQTGNLTVRARGTYNTLTLASSQGGYNSPPYTAQTLTGGSGTGMTASWSSVGGYVNGAVTVNNPGTGYRNGDTLTLPGGIGSTVTLSNYNSTITNGTTLGQADYSFGHDGNLSLPGNVNLSANSAVIGDFSNSTFNYRTVFRTITANSTTGIYAVPSGTGTGAAWQAANSSNIANTSKIMITTNGATDVQLVSGINGTGTYLPLSFLTSGATQMQLGTAGNLLMVTGGNISTTGNVIAGNVIADHYGNSIGTTATYSGNVTVGNLIGTQYGNTVGTTATYSGNVTVGNLLLNGAPISIGAVNGSYLFAYNNADQTSVGQNGAINFQVTSSSNGSLITKTSNSQITLAGGNTYALKAVIGRLQSSSTWAQFKWYDVTNAAYIGAEGFSEVVSSSGAIGSTIVPVAYVSPSVNTTYELRQTTVNTITVNAYASMEVTQINPTFALQGNANFANVTTGNLTSTGPTALAGNVSTGNLTVAGNLISTGYGFFPGAFSESSTSAGVFVGNTGTGTPTPRVAFFNGNTSQNWQIDNYFGAFRWFTPGVTRMNLDGNTNQLTVYGNVSTTGQLISTMGSANTDSQLILQGNVYKGGVGYHDFMRVTNTYSSATNPNKYFRLDSAGTLQLLNSAYSSSLLAITDAGDTTIAGNLTVNGVSSGYAPNRPAFRVYGAGTTNNLTTSTNTTGVLNSNNWAVDYNQGSHLNSSTGVFTAPVAGLYQVNLVARANSNSGVGSAIAIQKSTTNVVYVEWAANTSANHMGGGTVVKLAVGDTLRMIVLSGSVTFDLNDNWSVAYLG